MRILRQLSATILSVALFIPFIATAEVIKPALDIGFFSGDAGAELDGFDLTIGGTAFAIVQESAPAIDIPNQAFTLNATWDGAKFVGTFNVAGGLLSGTVDNMTVSVLSSGSIDFGGDLSYDDAGSLKGSLDGGRIEGIGNTSELFAKLGPVTVVPVPAALWLFGTGLIGLVGVARRKA